MTPEEKKRVEEILRFVAEESEIGCDRALCVFNAMKQIEALWPKATV